jgi:drug/metabolite transporter (DMT)-like permease
MTRWRSRLVLLAAATGWGVAVTATKYALEGFDPMSMLLVKLMAATAVLWTVAATRGLSSTSAKGRLAVLGFFEPALSYGLLTVGLVYTTATNASLLEATESVFVVILAAIFLHERLRHRSAIGLMVALVGVLALNGGFDVGLNVGDLLIVGGALAAAIYVTMAARIAPTIDSVSMTTYQFTAATVLVLPVVVWLWSAGLEATPTDVAARYWFAALLAGGVGYGVSFLLYNYAIRYVPAGLAGVILNLVPVIGVLTAVLFLNEVLTVWHIVGGVLIVGGIMVFPASKDEVYDKHDTTSDATVETGR